MVGLRGELFGVVDPGYSPGRRVEEAHLARVRARGRAAVRVEQAQLARVGARGRAEVRAEDRVSDAVRFAARGGVRGGPLRRTGGR